jgi:hypothetical protein
MDGRQFTQITVTPEMIADHLVTIAKINPNPHRWLSQARHAVSAALIAVLEHALPAHSFEAVALLEDRLPEAVDIALQRLSGN